MITIQKILTTVIFLVLGYAQLGAIPAKQIVRTIKQSDGTQLSIMLKGDESYHYFSTTDNHPLVKVNNGDYHYAQIIENNIVASALLAHDDWARNEEEHKFLARHSTNTQNQIAKVWSRRLENRNTQRAARTKKMMQHANERLAKNKSRSSGAIKQNIPTIGQRKGLVILVEFSDNHFVVPNTRVTFDNMMNKVGYKENSQYGSVHDYFLEQSYGQFSLKFDVVGPIRLSNTMAYYGENNAKGEDKRPGEMVAEACKLIRDQVNYQDYDWDNDGVVEQVYVIYSGYSESSNASDDTIWPHQWGLSSSDYGSSLFLDQVLIDTYACSSELNSNSGKITNGIGTICHELSHCLGLPDFYDTQGNNFGMNAWSLMDYGSYNNNGNTPTGYTSYEKMFCGWLNPIELNSPTKISNMKALSEGGNAYIIYNDANKDEYYMLENRQNSGWDTAIYGHGMLVLHVDYNQFIWNNNLVNNASTRQRMTIIAADNTYGTKRQGLSGDPFPGTSQNYSLTDDTHPASILYTQNLSGTKFLGKPIENISEVNGEISFNFMGGKKETDGVAQVLNNDAPVDVYQLNGAHIRTSNYKQWSNGLQRGIYLLRQGTEYRKIALP